MPRRNLPPNFAKMIKSDAQMRVRPLGRPMLRTPDVYHQLLRASWLRLTMFFMAAFFLFNCAFAGLFMLDRAEKTVRVLDEDGKVLRAIAARGPGYELKKPVDIAVDAFRNTYVAEEEGGVLVFSPQGQLLATVGSADLRKVKAVTLDPSGALLVYDEKLQRILRFK